jgi:hypothetical protein
MMTKFLKYANIVEQVNTNPIRARLLVSSVHEVKNKRNRCCHWQTLAKLVVWASTSQQQAKQHVSTVLKEQLQQ